MPSQTVTRAAESELEPFEIYAVLTDVRHIPAWAPVFADAIERIDDTQYSITRGGESFTVEVLTHEAAGTVDYVREMADGKRGGAYIRVTPRPLGGSAVTMNVPVGKDTNEAEVGATVEQELSDLIGLARRLREGRGR